MALINCPECGKEISSEAKACPNCGYEIKDTFVKEIKCPCCGTENPPKAEYCIGCDTRLVPYKRENAIENNNSNKNKKSTAKELFTIFAVILVIFFIINVSDGETQKTSTQTNKEIQEVTNPSTEQIQESIPDFEDFENIKINFKYKDIIRHPEEFTDKKIIITVEVKQVMKGGLFDDGVYYRVYTDNDNSGYYYDDEYFVYDCRKGGDKILEGDVIKVYGVVIGVEELKRALTRTTDDIPSLKMHYYELISE